MSKNDIILQDPLQEAVKSRLPEFAKKLGIDHFSPTQFTLADGAWLFKYVVLDQKMRRELLESNSAMEGGKRVGETLANTVADVIYKQNPNTKKVQPYDHSKISFDNSLQEQIEIFKEYNPVDFKDSEKKDRYLEELPLVARHAMDALIKLAVASPVTCERQISIKSIPGEDELAPNFSRLPVVGRIDFDFGKLPGSESGSSDAQTHGAFLPGRLIELKTKWSKLGKVKKDGSRSFIVSSLPATANFGHCVQVAVYAAYYDFKVPVSLVYANKNEFKIFDSSNCAQLEVEGMKKSLQLMAQVFKRREKILSMFDGLTREEIIDNAVEVMDPNFDHPFAWNGVPEKLLQEAKELWKVV